MVEALGEIVNNLLKHKAKNLETEFGVTYSVCANSIMIYIGAPSHREHQEMITDRLE
jgi:hypothetical protein